MSPPNLAILGASLVCSVDVLVLAMIWRRATRWSFHRIVRGALTVGGSHGLFAVIGWSIFTLFQTHVAPWIGDAFVITVAGLLVLIGFLAVRGNGTLKEKVPLLLLGVDGVTIGLVAGAIGGTVPALLILSTALPALTFGIPLLFVLTGNPHDGLQTGGLR